MVFFMIFQIDMDNSAPLNSPAVILLTGSVQCQQAAAASVTVAAAMNSC